MDEPSSRMPKIDAAQLATPVALASATSYACCRFARKERRQTNPQGGVRLPWRPHQNYFKGVRVFPRAPLNDEDLSFHTPAVPRLSAPPKR